ncbi:hypothetical protein ACFLRV_00320 [Candidatus Bipolaricaulota bacterium]
MLIVSALSLSILATDAEMYFSADKNGQNRVTNIQEGDEIWIVVLDNDQNIDCDIRDKMSPDLKIMDPKTGAYIVWDGHPGANTPTDYDYLEETGADTGVFVSARAFKIGTRESFAAGNPELHTHVVDTLPVDDFQGGHYLYADEDNDGHADDRGYFGGSAQLTFHAGLSAFGAGLDWRMPSTIDGFGDDALLVGRFENMDTLVGLYQDPNDATDIALAMMKIIDTEATISWSQEIYKDANGSATITVVDPDENLNCNEVELVPVFILINPGSWNPVKDGSPTNFCMLKRSGGVDRFGNVRNNPIRWYNIYQPTTIDSLYRIQYDIELFDTVNGASPTLVHFFAQETSVSSGVFQLNLNSILTDLEFNSLNARDVLVAYYLDPNDFDDFKLATAYIEERRHSITGFTDANRTDKDLYWIGRDPVYVQVIDSNANVDPCCPEQVVVHICDPHGEDDSEWLILDETSSNSPVFFTFSGTQLWPVWDALGVGLADAFGGFQLQLDNWKIEVFNEDDIYARYNDVYYGAPSAPSFAGNDNGGGMSTLGDGDPTTSFPPWITRVRVQNDVSFDLMSVADTQVYDGSTTNMWFLDRQGNRMSKYVNSDCVFIEVLDPDQDEDQYRRERIDGWWDEGQNVPFGPETNRVFGCDLPLRVEHTVNPLLGDTDIFNAAPGGAPNTVFHSQPKVYVLNPRSGYWAAVDLLETGPATGAFVSVICIDLKDVYYCVPQLDVLPGDTIIAVYQDPSNHSDSAWISIKIGLGGGGTPPSQQSTTRFVDVDGNEAATYSDIDDVFVKVIDLSHAGATLLASAVEIDGVEYDLLPLGPGGEFMTGAIDLDLAAGQSITATYTDPTNSIDTSSDTITIVSSVLAIESFVAGPSPFEVDVTFSYLGTGVASVMTLAVYDLRGHLLQELSNINASEIVWDGTKGARCSPLANGAYIYVVTATDGTNAFSQSGKVFLNR